MTEEEAYKILELSSKHSENIKNSYLKLSKKHHPDKGGDPEIFLKINKAYSLLTDVKAKEEYRKETIEANVEVSLEEAIFGVIVETNIRQKVVSTILIAEGKSKSNINVNTFVTKIPPKILLKQSRYQVIYEQQLIGSVERDVKIVFTIKEHERYKPSIDKKIGLLMVEEKIPTLIALNGGIVEIETLYGLRKIHIKPRTKIGDIYIIKNHGELGGLLIKILDLIMPEEEEFSEEQKKINEIWQKEVELEEKQLIDNEKIKKEIQNGKFSSSSSSSSSLIDSK